MKLFKPRTIWLPTWQGLVLIVLVFGVLLAAAAWNIHSFLAITNRVAKADTLVVEAWMPKVVMQAAVKEFHEGRYQRLMISEIQGSGDQDGKTQQTRMPSAVNLFVGAGIEKKLITTCLTPETLDHRSAAMAAAVRGTVIQQGITTKGFNVIAPAAHARKTWLMYSRALSSLAPVGIVAVPTGDYDPARWWETTAGAKWVIGNGIGWFYEWIAGP